MEKPPIYFIEQTLIIMVGNISRKIAYSKPCSALTPDTRDVPMHVKCNATAWCLLVTCMHIPTLFSPNCMLFKQELNHANWIFLSRFPTQTKKNSMHYFHFFFTQKLHVIQTRMKSCKLHFFPIFPAQKKTGMHYFHFFLHINRKLFKQQLNHANWIFFSRFPAHKKNGMHYFHLFFTRKLHVIQTRIKSCTLDFFVQISVSEKKKNNMHYFHFFSHEN